MRDEEQGSEFLDKIGIAILEDLKSMIPILWFQTLPVKRISQRDLIDRTPLILLGIKAVSEVLGFHFLDLTQEEHYRLEIQLRELLYLEEGEINPERLTTCIERVLRPMLPQIEERLSEKGILYVTSEKTLKAIFKSPMRLELLLLLAQQPESTVRILMEQFTGNKQSVRRILQELIEVRVVKEDQTLEGKRLVKTYSLNASRILISFQLIV